MRSSNIDRLAAGEGRSAATIANFCISLWRCIYASEYAPVIIDVSGGCSGNVLHSGAA